MNTPGFTAEASLDKPSRQYHTDGNAIKSSPQLIRTIYPAAPGQDHPNTTCACKKCDKNGGDLIGQCKNVCKDKEVLAKGSDPLDYCKASSIRPRIVIGFNPIDGVAFSG